MPFKTLHRRKLPRWWMRQKKHIHSRDNCSGRWGSRGFSAPRYPVELGGGGGDKITECIMVEELNRVNAGIAAALMAQSGLATQPIYRYGSEEQKQKISGSGNRREKDRRLRANRAQCGLGCRVHSDTRRRPGRDLSDQRDKDVYHQRADL